jgi:hypothetical protein
MLNFKGKRPALTAMLAGGCIVALAIYSFQVPVSDILQAALISFLVVLIIAIPAGVLVLLIKGMGRLTKKDKGK